MKHLVERNPKLHRYTSFIKAYLALRRDKNVRDPCARNGLLFLAKIIKSVNNNNSNNKIIWWTYNTNIPVILQWVGTVSFRSPLQPCLWSWQKTNTVHSTGGTDLKRNPSPYNKYLSPFCGAYVHSKNAECDGKRGRGGSKRSHKKELREMKDRTSLGEREDEGDRTRHTRENGRRQSSPQPLSLSLCSTSCQARAAFTNSISWCIELEIGYFVWPGPLLRAASNTEVNNEYRVDNRWRKLHLIAQWWVLCMGEFK